VTSSNLVSVGSELVAYALLILYIYSGNKKFGLQTTIFFLLGSLYFTLVLENIGVLMNFFSYTSSEPNSNPFYLLWVGKTPLWISVGWFDVTFPGFILLDNLISKIGLWSKAIICGVIAVSLDLIIDPAATAFQLWRWTHPSFYFLGVPITNYIAWFLLATFYIAVFESVHLKSSFSALIPFRSNKTKLLPDNLLQTAIRLFSRLIVFQGIFVVFYVPILYSIAAIGKLPGG
jgi:uncharacterized membrane protein